MTKVKSRSGKIFTLREARGASSFSGSLISEDGRVFFVNGSSRAEFERNLRALLARR